MDNERTARRAHRITATCPIKCLKPLLSARAFNPLVHKYDGPRTVGDVVELHQREELTMIRNLGPHRIAEIELVLVLAGLLSEHDHPYGTSERLDSLSAEDGG
ncbi:hypothetical protein SAMN04489712_15019 [Thermomonospora echinospora]|uniref:RNA polymerase, alpha chain C terminal domain n=1 Tax=Thermomonospora echinospora TaxID=1992 RepID=A0A1H6ECG9_9ACTN|nr:hypothetical protein [Thermomonospora echinospora]SEG94719.1 hypothetical protein SAMN04489712_15019 [Thermomonospora echinospora]